MLEREVFCTPSFSLNCSQARLKKVRTRSFITLRSLCQELALKKWPRTGPSVVGPCNLVNCSMRRCLYATSSFNFSIQDFFAKASSLRFSCFTCSRRSFSSSGGRFPSSEGCVSSGPVQ